MWGQQGFLGCKQASEQMNKIPDPKMDLFQWNGVAQKREGSVDKSGLEGAEQEAALGI